MKKYTVVVKIITFSGRVSIKVFSVECENKSEIQNKVFAILLNELREEEDSEMLEDAVFDFQKVIINIEENDSNSASTN